ncbi:MAG: EAL domain-containing protein, partial [Magnetospirillum sp.]
AFERLALENALRHALERQEFVLHYQPIFDTRSGKVVAVESLLRWQHPEIGLVMPNQFLPLAEETGLILPIGQMVLGAACLQAKAWIDQGHGHLRIGVNLSSRQFRAPDLLENVAAALERASLPPGILELDIPESCVTDKTQDAGGMLARFKALGVNIAIDDFGSGYSSFAFLRRLPTNALKIDQGFIRNVVAEPEDTEIITAIVAVARGLHMTVIAPGIETEEQMAALAEFECDMVQGFLFAHPMPAAEMTQFLRDGTVPAPLKARAANTKSG